MTTEMDALPESVTLQRWHATGDYAYPAEERDDGEFVDYDDYARLSARVQELERENARLLAANRDCVDHFEQMRAEMAALRESTKQLHRRCQRAESALPDYQRIIAMPPDGDGVRFVNGSLGRALLTALCDEQDAELAAIKKRIAEAATGIAKRSLAPGCLVIEGFDDDPSDYHGERVALLPPDDEAKS